MTRIEFKYYFEPAYSEQYGTRMLVSPKIQPVLINQYLVESGVVIDPSVPFCTIGTDVVRQLGLVPKQNIVEISLTVPPLAPMKLLAHVDDQYGFRLGYEGFVQFCSEICFYPEKMTGYLIFEKT